ncbi:hypothetical protein GCM10028801_44800 [Nocardioides maradonensis]
MSIATETALNEAIHDYQQAIADVQRLALLGLAETLREEYADRVQYVLVEPCDQGPYLCPTEHGAGHVGDTQFSDEDQDWIGEYVHNLWDPEDGTWTGSWKPFALPHAEHRGSWWLDLDLILFCGGDHRMVGE